MVNLFPDCGVPPAINNGEVNFWPTTFEAVATYGCDDGYELVGMSQRTCDASGAWSDGTETNAIGCRKCEYLFGPSL